ncbi:hypothetical protein Slin14017_G022070 [Septoria linicola]|nr:hypothetical protein Slin14017_G022070 [Septoria linicola]
MAFAQLTKHWDERNHTSSKLELQARIASLQADIEEKKSKRDKDATAFETVRAKNAHKMEGLVTAGESLRLNGAEIDKLKAYSAKTKRMQALCSKLRKTQTLIQQHVGEQEDVEYKANSTLQGGLSRAMNMFPKASYVEAMPGLGNEVITKAQADVEALKGKDGPGFAAHEKKLAHDKEQSQLAQQAVRPSINNTPPSGPLRTPKPLVEGDGVGSKRSAEGDPESSQQTNKKTKKNPITKDDSRPVVKEEGTTKAPPTQKKRLGTGPLLSDKGRAMSSNSGGVPGPVPAKSSTGRRPASRATLQVSPPTGRGSRPEQNSTPTPAPRNSTATQNGAADYAERVVPPGRNSGPRRRGGGGK